VITGANPQARYRGSKVYTRLKVAGIDVASMGRIDPELDSDEVIQVVETRRGACRKIVVRGRALVGAMLVGNTSVAGSLIQILDRGDPLPEDPLEVLCPRATFGGDSSGARMVCNCHKVSEARLRQAVADGAATVDALSPATKAGTGCGSCRTELAQLLGAAHGPPPAKVAAAS